MVGIFAIITVHFAPNALCCWVNGEAARNMEKLDEKKVQDTVMQVLRKFLSKKYQVPDPLRIVRYVDFFSSSQRP